MSWGLCNLEMEDAMMFLKRAYISLCREKIDSKRGLLFAREPIVTEEEDTCVI